MPQRDWRLFLILILAAIFMIIGLTGIKYCFLIGQLFASLYCFILARTSRLTAEIVFGYALSTIFMIDIAKKFMTILHGTDTIMHPFIQIIYVMLNWAVIISLAIMTVDLIMNIGKKPPKK